MQRSPESLAVAKGRRLGMGTLTTEETELYRRYFREATKRSATKYPDRVKARNAAWHKANYPRIRERVIARAVEWRRDKRRDFAISTNRKARKAGVPGRLNWRELVPGPCAYCGTPCESWDHVLPMSRGGPNVLENLVPACWPCNASKKATVPDRWLDLLQTLPG